MSHQHVPALGKGLKRRQSAIRLLCDAVLGKSGWKKAAIEFLLAQPDELTGIPEVRAAFGSEENAA